MSNYSVYSFKDTRVVVNHPGAGQKVLSDGGLGRLQIAYQGDMSSHTSTANNYTVVNRKGATNGVMTIEVPQNSDADKFLLKLVNYLRTCPTAQFALTNITLYDSASNLTIEATGVTPKQAADRAYDADSSMVIYGMLAADISMK